MAAHGYRVLGVGSWDLNYGLDYLREQAKKHGFHYVSANLKLADQEGLLFDPYAVVEKAGLKIGIISVLGQSYKITTMSAKADNFVIESPRDAMEKYLPELREKSDLVILLSNANTRDTRQLLMDLGEGAGIDLAIEGADPRQYRRLNKVGETYLVSANPQGKYLGQLDLMISRGEGIRDAVLQIHELGEQAPQVEEIHQRVEAFLEENKELAQRPQVKPEPVHGEAEEKFLGTANCANCHREDYEIYQTSAHAQAWRSLVDKGQTSNPDCISCHVVGWEWHGGYDPTAVAGGRNSLVNVQCEACHGYGTEHSREGAWLAEAKASCERCHTPDFDPDFDYQRDWKKIAH